MRLVVHLVNEHAINVKERIRAVVRRRHVRPLLRFHRGLRRDELAVLHARLTRAVGVHREGELVAVEPKRHVRALGCQDGLLHVRVVRVNPAGHRHGARDIQAVVQAKVVERQLQCRVDWRLNLVRVHGKLARMVARRHLTCGQLAAIDPHVVNFTLHHGHLARVHGAIEDWAVERRFFLRHLAVVHVELRQGCVRCILRHTDHLPTAEILRSPASLVHRAWRERVRRKQVQPHAERVVLRGINTRQNEIIVAHADHVRRLIEHVAVHCCVGHVVRAVSTANRIDDGIAVDEVAWIVVIKTCRQIVHHRHLHEFINVKRLGGGIAVSLVGAHVIRGENLHRACVGAPEWRDNHLVGGGRHVVVLLVCRDVTRGARFGKSSWRGSLRVRAIGPQRVGKVESKVFTRCDVCAVHDNLLATHHTRLLRRRREQFRSLPRGGRRHLGTGDESQIELRLAHCVRERASKSVVEAVERRQCSAGAVRSF